MRASNDLQTAEEQLAAANLGARQLIRLKGQLRQHRMLQKQPGLLLRQLQLQLKQSVLRQCNKPMSCSRQLTEELLLLS